MALTQDQIVTQLQNLINQINAPVVVSSIVVRVKSGDNLASMLASAVENTNFRIAPGAEFNLGNFAFPKPATLTIDADVVATDRAKPTDIYPKLIGIFTVPAPDVIFNDIAMFGGSKDNTILTTGLRTQVFRIYVHGNDLGQHRGIAHNSDGVSIQNCYIDNIWYQNDAQAIAGWDGCKNGLIKNNYLEASGENIIYGGQDPSSEANIPQNIMIQNNDLSKKLSWRNQAGVTIKNLIELKNGLDITVQDNNCEYSWLSGQTGWAILLTVRNQNGTAPYSTLQRIHVYRNRFNHIGAGIQILGIDDTIGKPSGRMTDVDFKGNVFTDLSPANWGGTGQQIAIYGGPKNLSFDGEIFQGDHINTALTFGGDQTKLCENLSFANMQMLEGDFGIHGDGASGLGKVVLDKYAPNSYSWKNMTITRNPSGTRSDGSRLAIVPYPDGTIIK